MDHQECYLLNYYEFDEKYVENLFRIFITIHFKSI